MENFEEYECEQCGDVVDERQWKKILATARDNSDAEACIKQYKLCHKCMIAFM